MLKITRLVFGILVVLGFVQSLAKSPKTTPVPTILRTEIPDALSQPEDVLLRKRPAREDSVVFKPLEYRYEPSEIKPDTLADKGIPAPVDDIQPARFEYHLGCGSFGQFDVDFTTWQQFTRNELKLRAFYLQNDGAFANNRLRTGIFSGQLSNQINPHFRINPNLTYTFRNYQLQTAPEPQTERKWQHLDFFGNVPIQTSHKSLAMFQLRFEHINLLEKSPARQSPFENSENTIYLTAKYFYRFDHSVLIFDVNFLHNSFRFLADSTTADLLSNVKTQMVHQFNPYFSVAAGVTLSNFSINETEAATRWLPYGKIIFARKNRWGIYLTASRKLEYQTFQTLWQLNPYLEMPNHLAITEYDYTLGASLELVPLPGWEIKLIAEQNKLMNAGYFAPVSYLYRYQRLPEATETIIRPQLRWQIHPALQVEWEASISHFQLDSTVSTSHLPFRENVGSKFQLDYDLAAFGNLRLGAQFIGTRYADFARLHQIDSVVLVNLYYAKKYNEYVTLFAQIQNLLNQDYFIWEGYREPGIYFLAGVSGKW